MGKYISYGKDDYKKTLAEFMATVNPKPGEKELEQLRKKYEDQRKGRG
jgi:hypothetical protein